MDEDELTLIVSDAEQEAELSDGDFEITEQKENSDGTFDVKFKLTHIKKGVVIESVPSEGMLIASNTDNKHTSTMIGHHFMKSRGDLISEGFDEELIRSIPTSVTSESTALKELRYQGGYSTTNTANHWASEELEVFNIYPKIDFDGDGITERRHVIKIGTEIVHNEPFDHVPYAISSALLMPDSLIGRSRAEITEETQLVKTTVLRGTMDNTYRVVGGRVVVNEEVTNLDDLLTERHNGIVRAEGDVRQAIAQLETPYVGDKMLQIMQYLDTARAQTTGSLLANQGLEVDLNKETATRFNGVQEAGAAKVELVARVIAEVGYRSLYEGIAWLVSHFQSTKDEILVNEKPLTVDPTKWWKDHHLEVEVNDDSDALENMGALLTLQNQLKLQNSPLVDDVKIYNTVSDIVQTMGIKRVNKFFNNPEKPDELLLFQNEQLLALAETQQHQLQAAQNPLAEAEAIKAQSDMVQKAGELQLKQDQLAEDQRQFNFKMAQDQQQFQEKLNAQIREALLKLEKDYTQLEVENDTDIPGEGAGENLVFDPETGSIS